MGESRGYPDSSTWFSYRLSFVGVQHLLTTDGFCRRRRSLVEPSHAFVVTTLSRLEITWSYDQWRVVELNH